MVYKVAGVSAVNIAGHNLSCQIRGPVDELLTVLAAAHPKTLLSREPSLEELFLSLYGEQELRTTALAVASAVSGLTRYPRPELALARFVGRHMVRTGGLWGLVIGFYTYETAVGYNALAPTASQRDKLLSAFASNTGLKALMGDTHRIDTISGFADWRVIGVTSIVVSVWAFLAATKTLRGEEAAGRLELFLAGQATARSAAVNALAGLAAGIGAMYVMVAAITAAVGARQDVAFSVGQSLFFGLTVVAGAAMFLGVGAVASEVMPTRSRAAASPRRRSGWPSCCGPSATPRPAPTGWCT